MMEATCPPLGLGKFLLHQSRLRSKLPSVAWPCALHPPAVRRTPVDH
jgi:hypothetical protein